MVTRDPFSVNYENLTEVIRFAKILARGPGPKVPQLVIKHLTGQTTTSQCKSPRMVRSSFGVPMAHCETTKTGKSYEEMGQTV